MYRPSYFYFHIDWYEDLNETKWKLSKKIYVLLQEAFRSPMMEKNVPSKRQSTKHVVKRSPIRGSRYLIIECELKSI